MITYSLNAFIHIYICIVHSLTNNEVTEYREKTRFLMCFIVTYIHTNDICMYIFMRLIKRPVIVVQSLCDMGLPTQMDIKDAARISPHQSMQWIQ